MICWSTSGSGLYHRSAAHAAQDPEPRIRQNWREIATAARFPPGTNDPLYGDRPSSYRARRLFDDRCARGKQPEEPNRDDKGVPVSPKPAPPLAACWKRLSTPSGRPGRKATRPFSFRMVETIGELRTIARCPGTSDLASATATLPPCRTPTPGNLTEFRTREGPSQLVLENGGHTGLTPRCLQEPVKRFTQS